MPGVSELRATCECTAPIMLRAGRVVCASCGAPITSATAAPETYTSVGPLPPKYKRRRFNERCRMLSEAQRDGGKRGRGVVWSISRAAWEASFAVPAAAKSNVVPIATNNTLIAAAGYRATKAAS